MSEIGRFIADKARKEAMDFVRSLPVEDQTTLADHAREALAEFKFGPGGMAVSLITMASGKELVQLLYQDGTYFFLPVETLRQIFEDAGLEKLE